MTARIFNPTGTVIVNCVTSVSSYQTMVYDLGIIAAKCEKGRICIALLQVFVAGLVAGISQYRRTGDQKLKTLC